jgi:hypothetical protein
MSGLHLPPGPQGYPTGIPGFSAFFDRLLVSKTGLIQDATQMNGYVNRLLYDGGPNCAAILPHGSPGNIVWVGVDIAPEGVGVPTPAPVRIFANPPDFFFISEGTTSASVMLPNQSLGLFICFRVGGPHASSPGIIWKFLALSTPGIGTAGTATQTVKNYY